MYNMTFVFHGQPFARCCTFDKDACERSQELAYTRSLKKIKFSNVEDLRYDDGFVFFGFPLGRSFRVGAAYTDGKNFHEVVDCGGFRSCKEWRSNVVRVDQCSGVLFVVARLSFLRESCQGVP